MEPWVYIVLLGAVAIVYALRLPARSKEDAGDKQSLKETEAALELYMADIEQENDKMLQLVSSIKQQSQNNRTALQDEINHLREQVAELQKNSVLLEARLTSEEKGLLQLSASYAAKDSSNPRSAEGGVTAVAAGEGLQEPSELKPKPVSSIKLRYPRLFELHEQGKSIDSIAKTAGLQRGEVQLILQLAKQEESV